MFNKRFKGAGYFILLITILMNTLSLISCCESVFYSMDLKIFLETQNLTLPVFRSYYIYLRVSFIGLLIIEMLLLSCHYTCLSYFFSAISL